MREFSLIIFLTVSSIYYGSARDVPNSNVKAVGIVLTYLPPNYLCSCKRVDECESRIVITSINCPAQEGCCLNEHPNDRNLQLASSYTPDFIPPPACIFIDRTPPNHSCNCGDPQNCTSKIYVKNVDCDDNDDFCCLQVGQQPPLIDYPDVYQRIYGIGYYAYTHQ